MKPLDRFRRWASAMEDIEDPSGAEVRRVRAQLRDVEARQFDRSAEGKRSLP